MGKTRIVRSVIFAAFMVFAMSLSVHAVTQMGACPVMPGHVTKEKFFVDYEGQRIYLCCRSCVRAFKKRPERYLKNLPKNLTA